MVNVQQEYVECASGGLVTETVNGNWLQAYCEFLGITEPSNSSWLQALCEHFGITQPLYGSWTIALANYYGITQPGEYGTWWNAIQDTVCTTPPITGCEWGSAQATFGQDSRIWSSTSPCTIPPTNENWEVVTRNWEVEPDNWEAI